MERELETRDTRSSDLCLIQSAFHSTSMNLSSVLSTLLIAKSDSFARFDRYPGNDLRQDVMGKKLVRTSFSRRGTCNEPVSWKHGDTGSQPRLLRICRPFLRQLEALSSELQTWSQIGYVCPCRRNSISFQ